MLAGLSIDDLTHGILSFLFAAGRITHKRWEIYPIMWHL